FRIPTGFGIQAQPQGARKQLFSAGGFLIIAVTVSALNLFNEPPIGIVPRCRVSPPHVQSSTVTVIPGRRPASAHVCTRSRSSLETDCRSHIPLVSRPRGPFDKALTRASNYHLGSIGAVQCGQTRSAASRSWLLISVERASLLHGVPSLLTILF